MKSVKEIQMIIENIVEKQYGKAIEFNKIESIRLVELIVRIENEFDIEFDDDDVDVNVLTSYEKLAEYVLSKL